MSAIFSLALGLFLLPPLASLLKDKFGFAPSKKVKTSIIVGLLLFFSFSAADPTESQDTKSLVPEKATTEVAIQVIEPTPTTVQATPKEDTKYYKVTKVVDGDTIDVMIDDKSERLRLIGIDTPETVDPRKPVQCFGVEASNRAKEILTGQEVALEADPTQGELDKYSRLLRYVFLKDGTNFALKMISEGYGHEYTYDMPYKYQSEFKEAEQHASTEKLGLWADSACPTIVTQTVTPVKIPAPAITTPAKESTNVNSNSETSFVCNCSKTCAAMSSCAEAQYQLNNCGCKARDGDKDGIACDSDCQ